MFLSKNKKLLVFLLQAYLVKMCNKQIEDEMFWCIDLSITFSTTILAHVSCCLFTQCTCQHQAVHFNPFCSCQRQLVPCQKLSLGSKFAFDSSLSSDTPPWLCNNASTTGLLVAESIDKRQNSETKVRNKKRLFSLVALVLLCWLNLVIHLISLRLKKW